MPATTFQIEWKHILIEKEIYGELIQTQTGAATVRRTWGMSCMAALTANVALPVVAPGGFISQF